MITIVPRHVRHLGRHLGFLKKKTFFAKLLETFDWNLKYCVLNNSVMCVDDFSVMFLLQIGSNAKSLF